MSSDLQEQLHEALRATHRIDGEMRPGGMSRLFHGVDLSTGARIVVKVLAPERSAGVNLERFQREILVASKLVHPGIVPVLSVGRVGSIAYYTMPFIEGESLRALLDRECQLSLEQAIPIVHDVADALDYANGRNIVHRDIKPDNILIDPTGRAVVTDFGVARAIEQSADVPGVTSTGITVGTPTYMSPEQAAANRLIDGRSDLYSLACVLYEMLAGEPPFTGPTAQAIIVRHMRESPRPLRIVRPDLPVSVQECIEKALAKVPAARHKSARTFAQALKLEQQPSSAVVPPRLARSRLILVAGSLAVVAAGITAARSLTIREDPSPPADLRHIAVMDFEDQSADRSLGYLARGLTASLVHELTGFGPLTVLPSNRLRDLQERKLPLDSIVAMSGLGSLVVGSVERSNDQLRVRVQLMDARSNTPLESAVIERPMGELFMLEDDLAHRVATLLRRRIGAAMRVREMIASTRSAAARELVFRADEIRQDAAHAATSADTSDLANAVRGLRTADSLLAAAERADRRWIVPVIDRGWVDLELAEHQSGDARAHAFRRAMEHAARALARDSTNAAAYELRGASLYRQAARLTLDDRDFSDRLARAEADLERAIQLDRSLVSARGTLALVRLARGDVAQGAIDAQSAFAMDTYLEDAPTILLALYINHLMQGATADAWRWCTHGANDYPRDPRFIDCQLTLLAEDDSKPPDPALAWNLVRKAGELEPVAKARAAGRPWLPIYRDMMAAVVSARAGDRDSALAVSRRAARSVGADATLRTDLLYEEAFLQLTLGDRAAAARLLSTYLAERPSLRNLVLRHPRWKSITSDSVLSRSWRD